MSEFSDSYHLLGSNTNEAVELLKKAKTKGFVFPVSKGKITFVADETDIRPNKAIIHANTGMLIHFVYPEDFGIFFIIYNDSSELFSYSCMWEGRIDVDDSKLDYRNFAEWLRKNTPNSPAPEHIKEMLHPKTFEEIFENPGLPLRIADLLRISNWEWTSYNYMELRSSQVGLDPGIVFVD